MPIAQQVQPLGLAVQQTLCSYRVTCPVHLMINREEASCSDYMTLCTTPLKYAVDGMYHDVGWGREKTGHNFFLHRRRFVIFGMIHAEDSLY